MKRKANLKICVQENPKCANCLSIESVSAHHIIFRSEGGDDSLSNLISLCFHCHRMAHDGYYIKNTKKESTIYISAKEFMIELLKRFDPHKYERAIMELEQK